MFAVRLPLPMFSRFVRTPLLAAGLSALLAACGGGSSEEEIVPQGNPNSGLFYGTCHDVTLPTPSDQPPGTPISRRYVYEVLPTSNERTLYSQYFINSITCKSRQTNPTPDLVLLIEKHEVARTGRTRTIDRVNDVYGTDRSIVTVSPVVVEDVIITLRPGKSSVVSSTAEVVDASTADDILVTYASGGSLGKKLLDFSAAYAGEVYGDLIRFDGNDLYVGIRATAPTDKHFPTALEQKPYTKP